MIDQRGDVLKKLSQYEPFDSDDRAQCQRIIQFVETTPDCFHRSHEAGHITGSAWIVDAQAKKILLTHHKKLNKWLQLGGHADGNSDVLAVALREAQEESGLTNIQHFSLNIFDVDIHPIPARPQEPAHFHYDIRFAFEASASEPLIKSDESNFLEWIPLDQLEKYSMESSLLRMKSKWLQRAQLL